MHHGASAAILAAGGTGKYADAPASRRHVIEHYNNLVAGEAEPLGTSGVALRRAFEERLVADYDLVENATMAEASELTAQARIMLDAIRQKWGFAA